MDGSRGWSRICGLGRTFFLHSQLFLYSISLFPRGETFKSISAGRKNEHYLLHWCECQTPLFLKKANIEVIKSVLWVRRTDTVHVTCPQHACIPKKLIEKVYCGPQRAATAGIGLGIGKCISSAFININAVLASSPGWWHLWEDMEKWTTEKQTGPTEGELHKEDTELKGTDKYGNDLIDLCRQGQYENRSENKSDLNSRISIT